MTRKNASGPSQTHATSRARTGRRRVDCYLSEDAWTLLTALAHIHGSNAAALEALLTQPRMTLAPFLTPGGVTPGR